MIWNKLEEFCKPQTNEVRAGFDLLTSFRQVIWVLMNGIMLFKHRSILQNMQLKQLRSYIETYFGFSSGRRNLSVKINDSNIDLEKFPSSKVRQLAKRLESSKSTARHIKKMSSDPQATQVNLLRHQWTKTPPSKAKRKQFKSNKFRSKNMGYSNEANYHQAPYKKMNLKTGRNSTLDRFFKMKIDTTNVVIPNI